MASRLAGFCVENYKAFASSCDVELRPLTVLFGYNSAGKSALLRALPLFLGNTGGGRLPLDLLIPAARGATFRDLVHANSSSQQVHFEVRFSSSVLSSARYTYRDMPELRRHILERLEVTVTSGNDLTLEWIAPSPTSQGSDNLYELSLGGKVVGNIALVFDGLRSRVIDVNTYGFPIELAALNAELEDVAGNVIWLSALRKVPSRWEVTNAAGTKIQPNGEGISQLLTIGEVATEAAFARTASWYESATKHGLVLNRGGYRGDELFSLDLLGLGQKRPVAMTDTGEGMGQVLPVIGALALAKVGALGASPILAIEHPELHLHPAAHADLAGLFTEVAAEEVGTLVVETHSENFILRLQLDIIEGRIAPEQVVLYWVRSDESGSAVVEKIEFDNDGRALGDRWPPGVFDENLEQARQIASARRRRSAVNEVHTPS